MAEDNTDPKVTSVATGNVVRTDLDAGSPNFLQIDLTFSEPMRVFPDDTGFDASLTNPLNYRFAFSDERDGLDAFDLEDATVGAAVAGTAPVANETAVVFAASTGVSGSGAFVEPDDADPRIVNVFVRRAAVPTGFRQVKVRVDPDVKDPAGNSVSDRNPNSTNETADNIVMGTI